MLPPRLGRSLCMWELVSIVATLRGTSALVWHEWFCDDVSGGRWQF